MALKRNDNEDQFLKIESRSVTFALLSLWLIRSFDVHVSAEILVRDLLPLVD